MSVTPNGVHSVAKDGFGGGTNELYDRARPSYQSAPLSQIRKAVKAAAPLNIVEIGAGTGIFTRALLAHPEWANAVKQLRAIEPVEGMRSVLSRSVTDDRVSVAEGTFDTTGVEDGWADLVVVAQAFHWCPDYDKAAAEFARILKPDGIVALIWNLEDREAASWVAQLRDRYEQHEQGTPQFRLNLWRAVFSTPSYTQLFQPPEEKITPYVIPGTVEITVERALSKSYIAVLSEEQKAAVQRDVRAIVGQGDGMSWMDKDKGVFEYPYKTYVVIWRKQ